MRLKHIDILKGLGILLVILYHSASKFPVDLTTNEVVFRISRVINTFFMQLFFFCSGFLMMYTENGLSGKESWTEYLLKRFKRLLIPYFGFAFIALFLRLAAGSITRSQTQLLGGIIDIVFYAKEYWFLFVLFVITVLFKWLRKSTTSMSVWIGSGVSFLLIAHFEPIELFHIDRITYFSIFVIMGYLASKYHSMVNEYLEKRFMPILLFLVYIVFFVFFIHCHEGFIKFILNAFLAVIAISFFYSISFGMSKCKNLLMILTHFSVYSLQYYLFHILLCLPVYYLVAFLHIPFPVISMIIIFLSLVILSRLILLAVMNFPVIYPVVGLKKKK